MNELNYCNLFRLASRYAAYGNAFAMHHRPPRAERARGSLRLRSVVSAVMRLPTADHLDSCSQSATRFRPLDHSCKTNESCTRTIYSYEYVADVLRKTIRELVDEPPSAHQLRADAFRRIRSCVCVCLRVHISVALPWRCSMANPVGCALCPWGVTTSYSEAGAIRRVYIIRDPRDPNSGIVSCRVFRHAD